MNNINIPHVHIIFWYRSTHYGGRQPLHRVTTQTGHVYRHCMTLPFEWKGFCIIVLTTKTALRHELGCKKRKQRTQGSFTNEVDRVILCCLRWYLKFLRSKNRRRWGLGRWVGRWLWWLWYGNIKSERRSRSWSRSSNGSWKRLRTFWWTWWEWGRRKLIRQKRTYTAGFLWSLHFLFKSQQQSFKKISVLGARRCLREI